MRKLRSRAKQKRTENVRNWDHDTHIIFNSLTRTIAAKLEDDEARQFLAAFITFLIADTAQNQKEMVNRFINELYKTCEVKAESKEAFKAASLASVGELVVTLQVLKERVDPTSELGAKVIGTNYKARTSPLRLLT